MLKAQGLTALLIIDVQRALFEDPQPLHNAEALIRNLRRLVTAARTAGVPVMYVQHNGVDDELAYGTPGWEIHPEIAPREGEPCIEKRYNDAFLESRLEDELDRLRIEHLIIAGLQTEFCIDTTCRSAFARGYQATLVSDGHSTYDTEVLSAEQIIAHHNRTLGRGLVTLKGTDELL